MADSVLLRYVEELVSSVKSLNQMSRLLTFSLVGFLLFLFMRFQDHFECSEYCLIRLILPFSIGKDRSSWCIFVIILYSAHILI